MIYDFEKWLKEKGCTDYEVSMYIINLKDLLNPDVSEASSSFTGFPDHLKRGKYRATLITFVILLKKIDDFI